MTGERLYNLLPSIYRIRDGAADAHTNKGPLRELMAILEREHDVVEGDIEQLYHNWFIETCEEWVVPYIGDLLNVRRLHPVTARTESHRAWVANTLSYRRRKGSAAVLEQLARDVTGWPARVVEFFQRLQTTQYLNHLRLHNLHTPDLRIAERLELVGSPFETVSHTIDVRRARERCGKYNIPNIGIFLWRLESYRVAKGTARRMGSDSDAYFTFHPLGIDVPLFNRLQPERDITALAGEQHVPGRLRRRLLYHELEERRQERTAAVYFGSQPVFRIYRDGAEITPDEIFICNLEHGHRPIASGVAVDPEKGRLAFPVGDTPEKVQVSYSYGFSGDIGAGPYNRAQTVGQWYPADGEAITWQIGVTRDTGVLNAAASSGLAVSSIKEAVKKWNDYARGPDKVPKFGIIAVMDSDSYDDPLTGSHVIEIPAHCNLAIVAADWPRLPMMGQPTVPGPRPGEIAPNQQFPLIAGNISVRGVGTPTGPLDRGRFICDGLVIEGGLTVLSGRLGRLLLNNTTLVPQSGGLTVDTSSEVLTIEMVRSICGPMHLHDSVPTLRILDSIVQSAAGPSIVAAETALYIQRSTVFGPVAVSSLTADNTIFTDPVVAARRQKGCVRFCYLPGDSITPMRYRCQPDIAILEQIEAGKAAAGGALTAAAADDIRAQIRSRIVPLFTSTDFGQPGFAQLNPRCPGAIAAGAEYGSEMGVFNYLKQPQRRTNLIAGLDEYLRLGLEAGIFYVT